MSVTHSALVARKAFNALIASAGIIGAKSHDCVAFKR